MYWKTSTMLLMFAAALPGGVRVKATVPVNLEVPAGNVAYLTTRAEGTQNYVCVLAAEGFGWQFFGPQATLFDDGNQQVATHFLSRNPDEAGVARATWQHSGDTSAVWAAAVANSSDPAFVATGAIPWLLLRAVGTTFDGSLAATTYIQRVNTAGGVAPASGCHSARDAGKKALVSYSTDYIFYRAN
jgi:hypothetical protein